MTGWSVEVEPDYPLRIGRASQFSTTRVCHRRSSLYGSVRYNRNLSKVPAHRTVTKSAEDNDRVLRKLLPCEIRERQPSSQRGHGEGNECCIICAVLHLLQGDAVEFEVLEVREESNEIRGLPTRTFGFSEGKESKRWREVPEALSNVWHKFLKVVSAEKQRKVHLLNQLEVNSTES